MNSIFLTCKTFEEQFTNTLSMKGHPIVTNKYLKACEHENPSGRLPWLQNCDIDSIIITRVRIHQMKSLTGLNRKQQSTDKEKAVYDACEGVHSGSDENHVRAEGFQREYKKNLVCLQYICVNTCKVMTPSQTAEMQQRWQHRAN